MYVSTPWVRIEWRGGSDVGMEGEARVEKPERVEVWSLARILRALNGVGQPNQPHPFQTTATRKEPDRPTTNQSYRDQQSRERYRQLGPSYSNSSDCFQEPSCGCFMYLGCFFRDIRHTTLPKSSYLRRRLCTIHLRAHLILKS